MTTNKDHDKQTTWMYQKNEDVSRDKRDFAEAKHFVLQTLATCRSRWKAFLDGNAETGCFPTALGFVSKYWHQNPKVYHVYTLIINVPIDIDMFGFPYILDYWNPQYIGYYNPL